MALTANLLLVFCTVFGLIKFRQITSKSVKKAVQEMPPMGESVWSYTKRLRIGQLWNMLTLRASSMSALTARIFMNRVRQLGYSLLYSHHEFERRVMDNNINDTLL